MPRLLVQLSLIQETAALILEQGVTGLSSFKVEDPETVPDDERQGTFLTRLPVRVRLTGSLPQLMKILGAIERASPLIDLRALRILPTTVSAQAGLPAPRQQAGQAGASGAATESLDVELQLARYLVMASTEEPGSAEESERPTEKKAVPRRTPRKPGQAGKSAPPAGDE